MADATATLGLDLTDVAKEIAKLPTMTGEAAEKAVRQMTRAFDVSAKEARRLGKIQAEASKAAAAEAKKLADAQRAVQQATAKTAESASKLAGALNMVSPELGALVNSGKAMADVMSVAGNAGLTTLVPALGAVAVIAAAVGAAFIVAGRDLENATAVMRTQAEVAQQVTDLSWGLERARIAEAVAVGTLTEAEGRQELGKIALNEQIARVTESTNEQKKAIEESTGIADKIIHSLEWWRDTLGELNPLLGEWPGLWAKVVGAVTGYDEASATAAKQTKALDQGLAANVTLLKEQAASSERAAAATAARAAAEKAASKATGGRSGGDAGAAAKAQADAAQRAAEQEAAVLDQLADKIQASQMARLEGAEQIDAAARAEIARLDEIARKHIGNAAIVEAAKELQVDAARKAQAEIAEIEKTAEQRQAEAMHQNMAGLAELIERTKKEIKEAQKEALDYAGAVAGSIAQTAGNTADALMGIAEMQAAGNEKAARRTFAIAKAASIAEVVMSTAQAVMSVWAVWSALPPVAAALAASVGAIGAVQIGKIAASQPTFHTGGVYSPDEGPARLRRGEGVLTSEATRRLGGEQGIAALNRGAGMQTQRVIVDWQDGAKGLSRTVARLSRQRGAIGDLAGKTYSGRNWSR